MPDPILYLQAIIAAVIVSAACVLLTGWSYRPERLSQAKVAIIVGIALALCVGYRVLHLRLAWPPRNGLDRLLTIILPAVISIELITAVSRVSCALTWLFRLSLVAAVGRILLHASVYLGNSNVAWSAGQAVGVFTLCGAVLAAVWGLLHWLYRRNPGASIPLCLALAILCAGLTVMLAGYVTGGAAALPLVAGLVGTSLVSIRFSREGAAVGAIGIAAVGLFGLLFVGRFFGGLSTATAVTIFLAPLLSWIPEIPVLGRQNPWQVGTLRLVLVAIPLVVVLGLAKRDFDRDTAPLLGLMPCIVRPEINALAACGFGLIQISSSRFHPLEPC